MLWVVTQHGRDKGTREAVAKFEDAGMEAATAMASQIVTHNKVSALIFLKQENKQKPLILRRIWRNWRGGLNVK